MAEDSQEQRNSLKHKTTKGILWGGLSNGIQQMLGFVFGIFLARFLTPADYGLVGMITIFSVIAAAFQESGFVNGIVNKRTVTQADYNAVFWCSVTIGTGLYILLFFCAPWIAHYYHEPRLTSLARLSFLSFWISSFGIAHNAYLMRNLMVRERAISTVSALIVSNIIGIFMAYNGFGYWGIAIQTILYSTIVNFFFAYFSKYRTTFKYDLSPIKDIFGFSSKILVTNIFININNNIYALILGKYYNESEVGYINQASKWNLMGQSVISNMVANITQPVLREIVDDEHRQIRVFRKILAFTAFLAFPLLFGLATVSSDFITISITQKWAQSAVYLRLLCIGGAFACVGTVFSNLILSKGKSNVYMWNILFFGLLQILILIFAHHLGITLVVTMTASLNVLWIFVWYRSIQPYVRYSFRFLLADVFSYMLLAAVCCLGAFLISSEISNIYLRFVTTIALTALLYFFSNRIFKPEIVLEIIAFAQKNLLKKK